ncbi:putative permease [Escherichia coli]|nr:putative permease [Escherichia coli]
MGRCLVWDAGAAQRTGGDAGFWFHPYAGCAVGDENRHSAGLLTMAIGEWVAPQGEQMARNYRAQAMYGGSLLSTQQGLWAKDGNNFVYIERVKVTKSRWHQYLCL